MSGSILILSFLSPIRNCFYFLQGFSLSPISNFYQFLLIYLSLKDTVTNHRKCHFYLVPIHKLTHTSFRQSDAAVSILHTYLRFPSKDQPILCTSEQLDQQAQHMFPYRNQSQA